MTARAAGAGSAPADPVPPPGLARRLACLLYEGVLLFGVLFTAALLYAVATNQRDAMQGRSGLVAVVFLVLAVYFLFLWTHGGQTLAMKTWHLRLVGAGGAPLRLPQALARYLACWVWFLPPLALLGVSGLRSPAALVGIPLAWIGLYTGLAALQPRRQFWHDALCGTELVSSRAVRRH